MGDIELRESRAMLYIPEDTIEIEMNVKVMINGKVETVSKTIGVRECQRALDDAERNYIEDSDRFELTDEGREWLEMLENDKTKLVD